MLRFILDTNHVSSLLKGDAWLTKRIQGEADAEIGIGIPSVAELFEMVYKSSRLGENLANLEHILNSFTIWPFDLVAAHDYGLLSAELRRIGRPIPVIDMQIAAIVRSNELILLTADKNHFSRVPGLHWECWTQK